jgi:hypothetical protein
VVGRVQIDWESSRGFEILTLFILVLLSVLMKIGTFFSKSCHQRIVLISGCQSSRKMDIKTCIHYGGYLGFLDEQNLINNRKEDDS